jgi:Na+/proline symporter
MVSGINKRKKWLRRAGLIAGIAGIIEILIWGLYSFEGGPTWIAIIPSSIFNIPLIAGLIVSWKWPFIGGLYLIGMAVVIFIAVIVIYFGRPVVNPTSELLMYAVTLFSAIGLPHLLPGILFTLSSKRSSKNSQPTS